MSTSTPWGRSDSATRIATGITLYSTPSHGGIHVSAGRLARMPVELRSLSGYPAGWYEEDCDWAAPAWCFPEAFVGSATFGTEAQVREEAAACLLRWHPELACIIQP